MSLAKLVSDGMKPHKCQRMRLREPPPVPYVPKKDEVQEEVSKMKNLQLDSLSAKSILAGEKLIATYSIST